MNGKNENIEENVKHLSENDKEMIRRIDDLIADIKGMTVEELDIMLAEAGYDIYSKIGARIFSKCEEEDDAMQNGS